MKILILKRDQLCRRNVVKNFWDSDAVLILEKDGSVNVHKARTGDLSQAAGKTFVNEEEVLELTDDQILDDALWLWDIVYGSSADWEGTAKHARFMRIKKRLNALAARETVDEKSINNVPLTSFELGWLKDLVRKTWDLSPENKERLQAKIEYMMFGAFEPEESSTQQITVRDALLDRTRPAHARCGKTASMLNDALERASRGETVLIHRPDGKNVFIKPVDKIEAPAGDAFGPIV